MKVFNFSWLTFVLMVSMFISCGDEDAPSSVQTYGNGVLIINEGPFTGGSATLDFYDREKDLLIRDVYQSVNEDQVIGSILQSVAIIGDNAFLMVNNSAKIEVVDANSMEYKNTISGVYAPRYMADLGNGMAVVSEWGLDGVSGQLKLVDLDNMIVVDSISASGPEQMVVANDKLYVANSGGFNESDFVSVYGFDLHLQSEISVGKRTIDMVKDSNDDIWVLSGGSFVSNDGANICLIKNETVESCIDLEVFPSDLMIDTNKENVYYVESGFVNKININNPSVSEFLNVDISGTIYGLGYDGIEDALYIGTTPDFSSESTTYVFDTDGQEIRRFTTGVLTNGFVAR